MWPLITTCLNGPHRALRDWIIQTTLTQPITTLFEWNYGSEMFPPTDDDTRLIALLGLALTSPEPTEANDTRAADTWRHSPSESTRVARRAFLQSANHAELVGVFHFYVLDAVKFPAVFNRLGCPGGAAIDHAPCLVVLNVTTGRHATLATLAATADVDAVTSTHRVVTTVPTLSAAAMQAHLMATRKGGALHRRPLFAREASSRSLDGSAVALPIIPALNTSGFATHVSQATEDVGGGVALILFHAVWCGFCTGVTTSFHELLPTVSGNISLFTMDLDTEQPPPNIDVLVTELPTVILLRSPPVAPIVYRGPHTRTATDFRTFLAESASTLPVSATAITTPSAPPDHRL